MLILCAIEEVWEKSEKKIKRLSDTFIKMNELYFSVEVFKSDGLEDVIRF